jgi:hypothetical protein
MTKRKIVKALGVAAGLGGPAAAPWALLGIVSLETLMGGCQTTTTRDPAVGVAETQLPSDRAATPDETVGSDESASRLHDIEGAILNYYIHNHYRLPNFLEDVKSFADIGTDLNFNSPSSGEPYVYSPDGLFAIGQEKRIIVWDPKPNQKGFRWCILMPPMQQGVAIVPEVVPIQEKLFQAFAPAVQ